MLMIVAALGALAGDLLSYWLGSHLSSRLQSTALFRKRQELLGKARGFFVAHGGKSVFFGRFLGLLRPFIPFVAGSAGMPAWRFFLYALVSGVLWGLAYPGLGYFFGASWQMVKVWSGRFSFLIAILLFLLILNTICWRRLLPFFMRRTRTLWQKLQQAWQRFLDNPQVKKLAERYPRTWSFLAQRFNPRRGSGLYLTVGFVFTALFSTLFIWVVQEVFLRLPIIRLDRRIYELLQEFHHPVTDIFFLAATYLGSLPVVSMLAGLLLLWLILCNRDFSAMLLVAGLTGGQGLVFLLKLLFQRPRPDPFYPETAALSASFPSAHAFNALIFYGLVVYFLFAVTASWRLRFALAFLASFLAMVIGFSRIYLGLHWASDVLGGFALAALWLSILITASEMRRRSAGEFPWRRGLRLVHLKRRWRLVILVPLALITLTGSGYYIWAKVTAIDMDRTPGQPIQILPESATPPNLALKLPLFTEDLGGEPERPLSLLIFADQADLLAVLQAQGWQRATPTGLRGLLRRLPEVLKGSPDLRSAALPRLVQGRTQDITLVEAPAQQPGRRVLLLWKLDKRLPDGRRAWGLSVSYHPGSLRILKVPLPLPQLEPQIDRQRDLLLESLRDTGRIERWETVRLAEPFSGEDVAGNDFHTDGRLYLVWLAS